MKVEGHVLNAICLAKRDDASATVLRRADNGPLLEVIHQRDEALLERP